MLVCIGEILADMIGESDGDAVAFKRFAGDAFFGCLLAQLDRKDLNSLTAERL